MSNPCPSLPTAATDDGKQFQCLNIVTKLKYYWNSTDAKKVFDIHKDGKYCGIDYTTLITSILVVNAWILANICAQANHALFVRSLMERRSLTSRYHGSKISGSQQ